MCFRFRVWYDGIHYFEIVTVRGYDHGEVRMVAENKLGREETTMTIKVYQAKDLRSVLHKGEGKEKSEMDSATLRQYRIAKNVEEKFRGKYSTIKISKIQTFLVTELVCLPLCLVM